VHWHSDVPEAMFASRAWLKPLASLYRSLEEALLRRAARIIVTSPPYLESSQTLSAFSEKCVVIPLGIPPPAAAEAFHETSATAEVLNASLKVLCVGRLSYYKGYNILLEAISQLPDVELQLVGDGELKSELQALAAALAVDSRVTFCGSLSDDELEAAWAWCDCLCLPSIERTEAFGVVLLEAMSRGKACFVSDVYGAGMGWVVEDGVTGLKVEPGSAKALSVSLQIAYADRAGLARMGHAGRAKFLNQLDIGISAHQVRNVYCDVIAHA